MIKKYSLDEIENISNNFRGEMNNEISEYLLEIKKNHSFSVRRAPIKLKYSIMKDWKANNKQEESKISEEEKNYQSIISLLNKLSIDNFNCIEEELSKIVDLKDMNLLIKAIFDKSLEDSFYCHLYIKILKNKELDDTLYDFIDNKCEEIYENFEMKTEKSENYNDICNMLDKKDKYLAFFEIISFLYYYEIKRLELVEKYWEKILKKISNIEDVEEVGVYIEAMIVICDKVGEKIYNMNNNFFLKKIYNEIVKLSENRKKLTSKNRFKIMDALDNISYIRDN